MLLTDLFFLCFVSSETLQIFLKLTGTVNTLTEPANKCQNGQWCDKSLKDFTQGGYVGHLFLIFAHIATLPVSVFKFPSLF